MKARSISLAIAILTAAGLNLEANAGPNDFFGSQIGGSPELTQGANAAASGAQGVAAAAGAPPGPYGNAAASATPGAPPSGEYSSDEKRVQKKYKENMRRAVALVKKGEDMMKDKDDKSIKKGRVLKEVGEKAIADLKANNPFPEIASKDKKTN